MKTLIEKKYLNIGFAAGLLILLAINVVTYINTSKNLNDEKWMATSEIIISSAENLIIELAETESLIRGHQLTDTSAVFQKYIAYKNQSDSLFKIIKESTMNKPEQKLIADSAEDKISERNILIKELLGPGRLNSSDERTAELIKTISIKYENIKLLLGKLKAHEVESLSLNKNGSGDYPKYLLIQIVAGTIVGFILMIAGIIFLNRSLRRRIKSEQQLEESRKWFSTTLRSIGDGVIVTNNIGDIVFMNNVAQELTGWTEKEAEGIYLELVYNVVNEETKEKIENPVTKVFKQRKTVGIGEHTILINKSGKEIPIDDSASPIYNDKGILTGIVLVFKDISERRKAELEIARNQNFIRRMAESIPNILYVYEPHAMKLVYANPRISEILGYSFEEAKNMGKDFFDKVIHPADMKKILSKYRQYKENAGTGVLENEYRIKSTGGEWRWMRSYDVIFSRGSNGTPEQMLGSALDITETKQLEEQIKKYNQHLEEIVERRTSELKRTNEKLYREIFERVRAEGTVSEAEEKFKSLVEHSLVGIYIIQDNRFAYVNPKFEEIFGYKENELSSKSVYDLVHPDYSELVSRNIKQRMENTVTDAQYTFKALRKDGQIIDVEVRGTSMNYEGKIAIIGTLQDITERKYSEDTLKEQEEFLRTVVNSAPNLIYVKDWDGKFVLVNKAASEYYSMDPSQIIGRTEAELGREKDAGKIFEEDREVMSSLEAKVFPEEMIVEPGTGAVKWMQIIKVPLVTYNNSRQVLCILTDISQRKAAEEHIIKSLKEKELLLQEIHHRVKNNLQIVISLLKLQSKYIFDRRDLDIFNKSRARIETMSLIHEKLYKSVDLEKINLGNYLKDLTSQLLKAYGMNSAQVNITVNSENVTVGIDTAVPCGLIANELVTNSLKHAFRINQRGNINLSIRMEDQTIYFCITDDGVGMPPGFGIESTDSLGLQLVTTLVKQLGGEIRIDSSRKGSVFSLKFPEVKYKERI